MATDIATRVYNHTFRIDPAIRTLLDTDFYKFLMLQMIWKMHRKRQVTFQLVNRTASVRLAEIVEERELVDQLDHARTLSLAKNELIWLAGNTFYGTRHIFEPDFMEWLAVFRLPDGAGGARRGATQQRYAELLECSLLLSRRLVADRKVPNCPREPLKGLWRVHLTIEERHEHFLVGQFAHRHFEHRFAGRRLHLWASDLRVSCTSTRCPAVASTFSAWRCAA